MTDVARVVRRFVGELDRLGIPYVIGGSFASSYWGNPRQTNDLDLAIRILPEQVEPLVSELADEFLLHSETIRDTLEDPEPYRAFQAIHYDEVFKIDVFVPFDTPYVRSEFERAATVEMLPGVFVRCAAPENVVLRKLLWYEAGNRVSDRQWNDLVRVLEVRRDALDYGYLHQWAVELGVGGLLDEAIGERDVDPFAEP